MITTTVLFHTDGTVASTLRKDGKWGPYWVLDDAATQKYGSRFFHPSKAKNPDKARRFNESKGFQEREVLIKGKVGKPDVRALINRRFEVVA